MALNWSEIPEDILDFCAARVLLDAKQIATFRSVCKSWKTSVTNAKRRIIPSAPYLILQNRDNDTKLAPDNEEGIRSFYCLSSKRVFDFNLPTQERRCWGTPYGWFFTMGFDFNINLFNPLSGSQISLPSQQTLPDKSWSPSNPRHVCQSYVKNFALTSDPSNWTKPTTSSATPLVIAMYGGVRKLAVACPGDESWTPLDGSPTGNHDILFYKNKLYIVGVGGVLKVCDLNITPLKVAIYASPPRGADNVDKFYLVEMSGDLHLVVRIFDAPGYKKAYEEEEEEHIVEEDEEDEKEEQEEEEEEEEEEEHGVEEEEEDEEDDDLFEFHYETVRFLVFKLNLHTREWIKLADLGGHAIFVGNHIPFAISASSYLEVKGNCIYFTDDHHELYQYRFCDMGVYDIKKKTVEPIYSSDSKHSKFARPSFFMPSAK
ncbi:hypothetical protein ACHQM5_019936 [Ranunculus cassubicifolius]